MGSIEKIIAQSFLKMADGLETGAFMDRPKIALTGMGSEHGEENAMAAAVMAAIIPAAPPPIINNRFIGCLLG